MKHPTHEEWVTYLYGECAPNIQAAFDEHLGDCASCRTQLSHWRQTQQDLDQSHVPLLPVHHAPPRHLVPWGVAALIAIGLAFLFGRLNGLSASLKPERQETPPLASQTPQPEFPDLVAVQEQRLAAMRRDLGELKSHVERLIARQTSETDSALAQLRHDSQVALEQIQHQLETVALVGESRYQRSRAQHLPAIVETGNAAIHFVRLPNNH